ncbi:hypothetical protein GGF32_007504 [Allomyces javanicus]|nr:hypothetical protein GGF32_007504 [Allomyces javanicus]
MSKEAYARYLLAMSRYCSYNGQSPTSGGAVSSNRVVAPPVSDAPAVAVIDGVADLGRVDANNLNKLETFFAFDRDTKVEITLNSPRLMNAIVWRIIIPLELGIVEPMSDPITNGRKSTMSITLRSYAARAATVLADGKSIGRDVIETLEFVRVHMTTVPDDPTPNEEKLAQIFALGSQVASMEQGAGLVTPRNSARCVGALYAVIATAVFVMQILSARRGPEFVGGQSCRGTFFSLVARSLSLTFLDLAEDYLIEMHEYLLCGSTRPRIDVAAIAASISDVRQDGRVVYLASTSLEGDGRPKIGRSSRSFRARSKESGYIAGGVRPSRLATILMGGFGPLSGCAQLKFTGADARRENTSYARRMHLQQLLSQEQHKGKTFGELSRDLAHHMARPTRSGAGLANLKASKRKNWTPVGHLDYCPRCNTRLLHPMQIFARLEGKPSKLPYAFFLKSNHPKGSAWSASCPIWSMGGPHVQLRTTPYCGPSEALRGASKNEQEAGRAFVAVFNQIRAAAKTGGAAIGLGAHEVFDLEIPEDAGPPLPAVVVDKDSTGRPYLCTLCPGGRTFKLKHHLVNHISHVHDKRKPFECPDCDWATTNVTWLKHHVRMTHDGEKNAALSTDHVWRNSWECRRHNGEVLQLDPHDQEGEVYAVVVARAAAASTAGVASASSAATTSTESQGPHAAAANVASESGSTTTSTATHEPHGAPSSSATTTSNASQQLHPAAANDALASGATTTSTTS